MVQVFTDTYLSRAASTDLRETLSVPAQAENADSGRWFSGNLSRPHTLGKALGTCDLSDVPECTVCDWSSCICTFSRTRVGGRGNGTLVLSGLNPGQLKWHLLWGDESRPTPHHDSTRPLHQWMREPGEALWKELEMSVLPIFLMER